LVHEVDTGDRRLRERYATEAARQRDGIAAALRAAGASHLRLRTDTDWLREIVHHCVARRRTHGAVRPARPGAARQPTRPAGHPARTVGHSTRTAAVAGGGAAHSAGRRS